MTKISLRRGQRIQLRIDQLSQGGRGVGRYEGVVIFVSDVAPDEEIEVEITNLKKSFAEGRLLKVLRASPSRVIPPCPVAHVCGGCNWQHVAYAEQLKQKKNLVMSALKKFSGPYISRYLNQPDVVQDVTPSPSPLRYRNRIQLHHQGERLGFHKRGSHEIVDIQDCLIAEETLTKEFLALKQGLKDQRPGRFELYIDEVTGLAKMRKPSSSSPGAQTEFHEDNQASLPFSQVNTKQNQNLIGFVLESLRREFKTSPLPHRIYDLYAGNGNFTFPLAAEYPDCEVVSVELNEKNVLIAQEKTKSYPKSKIRFAPGDVASVLSNENLENNDVVLLDPPRDGCDERVTELISQWRPRLLFYISCHPVTLARDLQRACGNHYELFSVQPFDMFPQTDHVETVALLRRISDTSF